jgi:hypothetical protein
VTVDAHSFRAAWQTRDLDAWSSIFAPDIVLRVLTLPLRPIFALGDFLAPRLTQRRG